MDPTLGVYGVFKACRILFGVCRAPLKCRNGGGGGGGITKNHGSSGWECAFKNWCSGPYFGDDGLHLCN